ncbi:coiled-coil domain-containing protein 93 isoform X1 [Centruroides vittatus]|uniref:coiled-coil domain-containing protein 93 isoform X1 n=2 Tax=Centruroides vittatus TaxID=120091 RepID=UPI00350EA252
MAVSGSVRMRLKSSSIDYGDSPNKVETREDEEQAIKLQEIIDLLLAAGYFRARIKGLSSFDKVVGGMTWCIETCNVDIDVDLLFQENLTIGQKISLTEKIVAVLPKMKCPHRLEPHQIQGLDCIHIFPVIQWLVKKAIETRQEMGDYIRAYSIYQFSKNHSTPQDVEKEVVKEKVISTLKDLKESYQPKRRYRHHASHKLKEEEVRVQTTLLEYGRKYGILRLHHKNQATSQDEESNLAPKNDVKESKNAEETQIDKLMSGMSAMDEFETKVTASVVGSIVSMQSDKIQQIASEFADKQAELASEELGEKYGGIQHHKRVITSLNKQITDKTESLNQLNQKYNELKSSYEEKRNKLKELNNYYDKLSNEMEKFETVKKEDKEIIEKLNSLVLMNENLKHQEQEFKSHCKEELARLQADIEEVKSSNKELSSEDKERREVIEKQYSTDKEKLQKIRGLLARKNREIASLQRKIDEVPARAELSQYQRRFVELYNQVAAKHKETKQFYTLYNTLDDTKMYLSKEVNLLNSILDNFSTAMASPGTRDQFLSQFQQIVDGICQNKIRVEKKKQEEKMKRDQLNDTYLDLVEKQRLYFKTVKDFKEECRKNELLAAKVKEVSQERVRN